MACASSQSVISASSCRSFPSQRIPKKPSWVKGSTKLFSVTVSSSSSSSAPEEPDCNVEECAPDKEVGKVSMEWLAGEKTKVVGTYPPKKKGWTGYIEKDTAGQTNIYSVEPSVYVAESAISSGTAGTSADGAENTAAIAAGLALIFIAAASSVLIQVSKKAPEVQKNVEYSGPPLSYYINKFKPATIVEAPVAPEPQSASTVQDSALPEGTDSDPQIASDVQSEGKATVIPEVQVEMEEPVEAQSLSSFF